MDTICPNNICTGCGACLNVCPKKCIQMVVDEEGFLFPAINEQLCNNCDVCRRTCPALSPKTPTPSREPNVYACWNRDNPVRFQSASGGVFSALADEVLRRNGVVYGAAFDENAYLRHISVENKGELWKLRSSKYIQSDVGAVYTEIKQHLKMLRPVLFSGTPCQVAALQACVGNDANLFTADLFCHGVPSPGLFAHYADFLGKRFGAKLTSINFRHKRKGWELPICVANFDNFHEQVLRGLDNSYVRGFHFSITLRLSCYQCPYATIVRRGDVSLADFSKIGEIQPFEHSVKGGISLVLANTEKGEAMLATCSDRLHLEQRTLAEAKHSQPRLGQRLQKPGIRELFWADYQRLEYEGLAKQYLVEKGWKALLRPLAPPGLILFVKKKIKKVIGQRKKL